MDLSNIKVNLYNILVIMVIVALGVPLLKIAVNRFPLPGVTPTVNMI